MYTFNFSNTKMLVNNFLAISGRAVDVSEAIYSDLFGNHCHYFYFYSELAFPDSEGWMKWVKSSGVVRTVPTL